MLDRIINETIYNFMCEEYAGNIHIVKDEKHGDVGYFLMYNDKRIGSIRVSEISKKRVLDLMHNQYLRKLFVGITFPAYIVDCFFVSEEYRMSGYGRQLLKEVINDFGRYTLILQAASQGGKMPQNQLVKMYQRYGFKHAGRTEYGAYMIRLPEGAEHMPRITELNVEVEMIKEDIITYLKHGWSFPVYEYGPDKIYKTIISMLNNGEITNDEAEKAKEYIIPFLKQ